MAFALLTAIPALAQTFTPGNLVVTVEGNGVEGAPSGLYTDNQASPLTLFQFSINGTSSATYVNSYVLPQTASGANSPVSAEYGSSSEGTLQLSGNGNYLTVMGYGVNADDFNGNPGSYSISPSNTALGQSGSMTGQTYTPVPRVVALIDANGDLDSTTALYNIFNGNNPRSIYTADGINLYVSGQGNSPDTTGGVFFTTLGSGSATAITGLDTSSNTLAQDTRDVQINFNTLDISVDSKEGSNAARDFIGTLGSPASTSLYNSGAGPTQLPGFATSSGKVTITSGAPNTGNGLNAGKQINISPNNYFFANSSTLYVADGGAPKNNSASSSLGDGGLQKWSLVSGSWVLDYTLAAGLNLVANTNTDGTSGLYGLTGVVNGTQVQLYATNYTLADLDQTYLYGITDTLSDTTASQAAGESFTQLAIAPADSNFKGVAFAPNAVSTPTATATATATPTATATATATTTATATATDTATATATATDTATATATAYRHQHGNRDGNRNGHRTPQPRQLRPPRPTTATATATATPTATATATATDTATATATNTATATATPTATPTTSMSVTASLAFANVAVGQTSTKTTVTVTNTGRTNSLIVSAATPSDPEYALSGTGTCGPLPVTLAHGTHCTLGISFSPSAVGPHPASLMLFDNATSSPQQVTLTGTGIAGLTTTKSSLVYGDVKFGAEGIEAFSVVNHQTQPVSLSESFGGTNPSDFSVTEAPAPRRLAADKACSIIVSFSPSVLGTESATLSVSDSPDPLSPYTVALSTGPTIPETIAPVTLAYGTLTARTPTKTKDVTITNMSGFPLSVGESFSGPNADRLHRYRRNLRRHGAS